MRRERLALVLLASLLAAPPAAARVYPTPILTDNEDELRLLYEDGLISEDEFQTLVDLLTNPLNVNEAPRNALYDLPGVTQQMARDLIEARRQQPFGDLRELSRVEGFTPDVLDQLDPFAYAAVTPSKVERVVGRVKIRSAVEWDPVEPLDDPSPNDSHRIQNVTGRDVSLPATYVSARAHYGKTFEAGFLGLAQEELARVEYLPARQDLVGTWGTPSIRPAKGFFAWNGDSLSVIAGSYGAGFGLGLTFDRTNRVHPAGAYADLSINGLEDYTLPRQLFGAAVTWSGDPAATLRPEVTAFASSQRHDLYIYDLGLAGGEPIDPLSDEEITSPRVYVDGRKVSYLTIPNAYRDSVAGANVTLNIGDRAWAGVTGYVGQLDTATIPGVEEQWVLAPRDGYPAARTYGAAGLNGGFGRGPLDLLGEAAVTFTGGAGGLVKAIITPGQGEIEASLRRYGAGFDNPHARGIAAPDQYAGMRDRDEQGARLRGQVDLTHWIQLRATADVWQNLSPLDKPWNLDAYAQVRFLPVDGLSVALFADRVDRDLARTGRDKVYGGEFELDELAEPDPDNVDREGTRNQFGVQTQVDLIPRVRLSGYYRRVYEDAALLWPNAGEPCFFWYQIGHYTWLRVQVDPIDATRVSARVRYMDEDVHGSLGDRFVEGYLQIDQKLPRRIKLTARGTVRWDLYDPEAPWKEGCEATDVPLNGTCVVELGSGTDTREPAKPSAMGWLSAEVRF